MEEADGPTPNLEVYRRRTAEGWRLVDVDSTDNEVILTLRQSGRTLILPLSPFEAAKLAGFDALAAQAKLRDILGRLRS